MRPELQLLDRHPHLFASGLPTLIVDPPDTDILRFTTADTQTEFWTRNHGVARRLQPHAPVHSQLWAPDKIFERAILFLPKGRQAQNMTFAQVRRQLAKDRSAFVVGANQAGIKGALSHLRRYIGDTRVLDTARRCTLVQVHGEPQDPDVDDEDWRQQWSVQAARQTLHVISYPGTFSAGVLDKGTELLLTALSGAKVGLRVLDLGCGSGVLGGVLAKANPKAWVQLLDIHAAAVASTAATLARNNITNASCAASEWYEAAKGPFDTIVCNPPFHQGIRTDVSMIQAVLDGAPGYLDPKGMLWLVANRHLPYMSDLQKTFAEVTIARETTKFRVYRCRQPLTPTRLSGKSRRAMHADSSNPYE
ncbi:MAG: methyltransferase [Myxococcota bacterium]